MKTHLKIFHAGALALLTSLCIASTISPPEKIMIGQFLHPLNEATQSGLIGTIQEWRDIEHLPVKTQLDLLGAYSQKRVNVSDYFSIILLKDRGKFPDRKLVFVSAQPFNETRW
ncbi:MAG: hypothetical protein WC205_17330 [Opitutaceae bacterium]|jgi:hypothetical protein